MPTLKTVRDSLDDVPDALHELYEEKDGKFILSLEDVDSHPTVIGLKNALSAQKTARLKAVDEIKTLKARLEKIPEDFDADEFARIKAQLEEYEADPAKRQAPDAKAAQEAVAARKMLEQKISNMEKAHANEIEKLKGSIKLKDAYIGKLLVDDGLTKALVDVGIGKEFMKAAKALLRTDVKVIEEDGDYKAIVETDTGPLDISKYVSDWVASDEGKVFVPPPKGGDAGTGTKPTKPTSTEKNPWSKEAWNLTEQGKLLKADRVKADKLAKAAGQTIPAAL